MGPRTKGSASKKNFNEPSQYGNTKQLQVEPNDTALEWAEDSLTGQERSVGKYHKPPPESGNSFLQGSARAESCIVVEYYKDLNPITILREALNQPVRQGLVQGGTDHVYPSKQEYEKSLLDPVDQAYFRNRHVHELPQKDVR